MLSASTARLVEGAATLGELEMVRIKGAQQPVPARRLLGMADEPRALGRAESTLVGRRWEMAAVEGLLERAIEGHGGYGRRSGITGYRQEPSGARGHRNGGGPGCRGVRRHSANRRGNMPERSGDTTAATEP